MSTPPLLRFHQFELRISSYELRRSGEPVKVERIPMELLILLVERRGELVSRDVIVDRLWGEGVFLETEHSINTAINKLRAVLADPAKSPLFIQTVVGKGYRFIADVETVEHSLGMEPHPSGVTPAHTIGAQTGALMPTLSISIERQRQFPDEQQPLSPGEKPAEEPPKGKELPAGGAPGEELPLILNEVAPPQPSVADSPPGSETLRERRWLWRAGAMVAGLAVVVGASLLLKSFRNRSEVAAVTRAEYHSVAVLPFADLSASSDKEYLVDGMTDELITQLARGTSLRVISRTSTMQFKGVKKPLAEIASALNVDTVVEGSVMRSGTTVRITAQLLDARRDQHLWAQTYQMDEDEPLATQDQVTADIAAHVAQRLTNQAPRFVQATLNSQALDLYLRGGYLWQQRTPAGLTSAIEYYKQAIRLDPNFALAYAALGKAYALLSTYGGPEPSGPLLEAKAAAEKALQLNSRLGDAHTVLAAVKVDLDWDWNGAEIEFQRAIELDPSDPTAHHWYALQLARSRRFAEAEVEMQRAFDLDPASIIIQTDRAEIAYYAHDLKQAEMWLQRALELNENFADAHLIMGKIYEQEGRYPEALAEFQRALSLFGQGPNVLALEGHALALAGRRAEAEALANELVKKAQASYVSGVDIAVIYCALKEPDQAMEWFERAYQKHDKGMDIIGADPLFDGCRNEPRFADLLRRLRLPSN